MTLTAQTNTTLECIAKTIEAHDSFVICGHVSPDGDCIGSQLALMHALRAKGKKVDCLLVKNDPLPADLDFMPGCDEMIAASAYESSPHVFVGVDVPSRERLGMHAAAILDRCATSITIDHHACDRTMCEMVYVDPDSPSASILVWQLVKMLCQQPPAESALCAYAGLLSDTGGFRFQNSTPEAFEVASELVSYGVDPAEIASKVYQSRTMASLKLEALVIERIVTGSDGDFVLSWLSKEDFSKCGAQNGDAEYMIDTLRSLKGVRVACMLREQDSSVRGSLRAKDSTDVQQLAVSLGGGGHKAAAGFTLQCSLEDAVNLMTAKLEGLVSHQAE